MDRKTWWDRAVNFWKGTGPTVAAPRSNGTSAALRLVFDTGVVAQAAREPDSDCRTLLDAVAGGRVTMLISPALFVEYRDRLPGAVQSPAREKLVRSWIGQAESVSDTRGESPAAAIDDTYFALADAGRADAVVTTDERRLAQARRRGIRVVDPRDALRLLN